MKVFVINPTTRTIEEQHFAWNGTDYSALLDNVYRLGKFDCFDTLRISASDRIYLDDEGLLSHKQHLSRWNWQGYENPLAGIGVVMGSRGEDTADATSDLPFLSSHVIWKE